MTVFAATVQASYVVESLSFGHRARYGVVNHLKNEADIRFSISPNSFGIPGWHIIGEGHTPQLVGMTSYDARTEDLR